MSNPELGYLMLCVRCGLDPWGQSTKRLQDHACRCRKPRDGVGVRILDSTLLHGLPTAGNELEGTPCGTYCGTVSERVPECGILAVVLRSIQWTRRNPMGSVGSPRRKNPMGANFTLQVRTQWTHWPRLDVRAQCWPTKSYSRAALHRRAPSYSLKFGPEAWPSRGWRPGVGRAGAWPCADRLNYSPT